MWTRIWGSVVVFAIPSLNQKNFISYKKAIYVTMRYNWKGYFETLVASSGYIDGDDIKVLSSISKRAGQYK